METANKKVSECQEPSLVFVDFLKAFDIELIEFCYYM